MGIFCLQMQVTLGHPLCVSVCACLFTSVGLLSSMLLDPLLWCRNNLALLKRQWSYRMCHCKYPSPPLSSPTVSRSAPCSILHGNTHGSVNIIVHVCMMSVSLFGWECHVKLLEVTYTHTHMHMCRPMPSFTWLKMPDINLSTVGTLGNDRLLYSIAKCFCPLGISVLFSSCHTDIHVLGHHN